MGWIATTPKYVGKIWPTGKFGVSRVREAPFLSQAKSQPETEETQFRKNAIAVHGLSAVAEFEGKADVLRNPDLSNVPKSPIRSKRGQKGITRHGRNLISSAAVVAESQYGRSVLTFGTVTLPSAPVDQLARVSANWSDVVKRFLKNLGRGLQSRGLPALVFGVTEIQESRLKKTGVPALHLHFVYVGRKRSRTSWLVNRKDIRRIWIQAIAPYFSADTDFSSTENVQGVKKSAASYLGKYMSKGAGAIAKLVEAGLSDWIPSAWYFCTHDWRRHVLSKVFRGEEVGNWLNWLACAGQSELVRWCQAIKVKCSDGREVSVGYSGTLTSKGLALAQCFANWNAPSGSS